MNFAAVDNILLMYKSIIISDLKLSCSSNGGSQSCRKYLPPNKILTTWMMRLVNRELTEYNISCIPPPTHNVHVRCVMYTRTRIMHNLCSAIWALKTHIAKSTWWYEWRLASAARVFKHITQINIIAYILRNNSAKLVFVS